MTSTKKTGTKMTGAKMTGAKMMGTEDGGQFFVGQLLVAMPAMRDPRFAQTVIYMCAHSADGAMGLVLNRPIESLSFPDLLQQLDIDTDKVCDRINVHFGGPVESERGFVLHSPDYVREATLVVNKSVALTASIDILKAIAAGNGPRRSLLALGYAGWGAGQLDSEIKANGWLTVPADEELVFGTDTVDKWKQALGKLGIDPLLLSDTAGHA